LAIVGFDSSVLLNYYAAKLPLARLKGPASKTQPAVPGLEHSWLSE
jgi:hypothetical protein